MDVEWGPETAWGSGPRLDEFLLARIAEDERLATTAATGQGTGDPPDEARHRVRTPRRSTRPVSRPTAVPAADRAGLPRVTAGHPPARGPSAGPG